MKLNLGIDENNEVEEEESNPLLDLTLKTTIADTSEIPTNEQAFINHPKVQQEFDIYYDGIKRETKGLAKLLDAGSWFGGSSREDIAEALRDETYRITTAMSRSMSSDKLTDREKEAYRFLKDNWENVDSSFSEAAKDIASDIVFDPVNAFGLLFTGGYGNVVGLTARQQIGRAALAGGVATGGEDILQQQHELNTDYIDEYNFGRTLTMTAAGTALGGGLGAGISGAKQLASVVSNSRVKGFELNSNPTEMGTKKESINSFTNSKETEETIKEKADILEGEFIGATDKGIPEAPLLTGEKATVIVDDIVETFKGGPSSKEEMQDVVEETIASGGTPKKIKSNFIFNVSKLASRFGGNSLFKHSSVLDAYTKFSDTARELQKKFRYDAGRSFFTGSTTVDGQDFNEYFRETLGRYTTRVNIALEPIQLTSRGKLSDVINKDLLRSLRGKSSDNENINLVAKEIRGVLDEIGARLKENKLIEGDIENYVPRQWDRKSVADNKEELAELLESEKIVAMGTGKKTVEEMLDKANQLDKGGGAGSTFFFKRVFTDLDDNKFEKFLDTDTNRLVNNYVAVASKQLAKKDILGVSSLEEFKDNVLSKIVSEIREAGGTVTGGDREAILNVYKIATGEGLNRHGGFAHAGIEGYATFNRLAYLPLATASSITEIMINLAKAPTTSTLKGFAKATDDSREQLTTAMKEMLGKQGLTETEIRKEMNEFGLALSVGIDDTIMRLSDEAMNSQFNQKVNNVFFRATFLDQWTKLVQTSSYVTGKDLINTNLSQIKKRVDLGLEPSVRTKRMMTELNELGVDINEGISWLNNGSKIDDPFYTKLKRGAARYTNEVILNPNAESGLKPAIMSHPKTAILFQFLGYPTAFTNTVLKNAARSIVSNPADISNVAKTVAAGTIMTEMARTMNFWRSDGESEKFKDRKEIYVDAISRFGGFGVVGDALRTGTERATMFQDPLQYGTGFLGPVASDVLQLAKTGDFVSFVGKKAPLYGAGKLIFGKDVMKDYNESLKDINKNLKEDILFDREPRIQNFAEGGKVDPLREMFSVGSLVTKAVVKAVPDNLMFYSPLQKFLLNYNQPQATAQQLSQTLIKKAERGEDNITKEEINLTGLNKLAKEDPNKIIATEDIQNLLASNRYVLTEKDSQAYQKARDIGRLDEDTYIKDFEAEGYLSYMEDTNEEDMFLEVQTRMGEFGHYGKYTMGGDLTNSRSFEQPTNYKEILLQADPSKKVDFNYYSDRHYSNIPNVVGFVRLGDYNFESLAQKTSSDKPTIKIIEEVQSDYDSDRIKRGTLKLNREEYSEHLQNIKNLTADFTIDDFILGTASEKLDEIFSKINVTDKVKNAFQKEIKRTETDIDNLRQDEKGYYPANNMAGYVDIFNKQISSSLKRALTNVVPDDLPFKGIKRWGKLLIERSIVEAVIDGSDYIGMPTSKTIQNRYAEAPADSIVKAYDKEFKKILERFGNQYGEKVDTLEEKGLSYHYLKITDEMAEDVLEEGRSMFNKGGRVKKDFGGLVAMALGIKKEDLKWAKSIDKNYAKEQELDGTGDAARHLALGWAASKSKNPKLSLKAINAREHISLDQHGLTMDKHNNNLGFRIKADTQEEATKIIDTLIKQKKAMYITPEESYKARSY